MIECLFTNLAVVGLSLVALTEFWYIAPALSKEFLDIHATIKRGYRWTLWTSHPSLISILKKKYEGKDKKQKYLIIIILLFVWITFTEIFLAHRKLFANFWKFTFFSEGNYEVQKSKDLRNS